MVFAFFLLLIGLLVFGVLAFEIWMFIDAITNKQLSDSEKALWCIGMVFIHPVVAVVYFFVVYLNHPKA